MKDVCLGLPYWGQPIIWLGIFAWEFLMGETRYGSSFRLVAMGVASIFKKNQGDGK